MAGGADYVDNIIERELAAFDILHDAASRDFTNLEAKANALADQEFQRLGQLPVGDDDDGDMAHAAERADAVGQAFYERTFPLAQTLSNLLSVGLFHLFEQHLNSLCDEIAGRPGASGVDSMQRAFDWLNANAGINAAGYTEVTTLTDLKLAANVIKHSEGRSANDLRARRPDLFVHPGGRGLVQANLLVPTHVGRPLTGESVYVSDADYAAFQQAVRDFWTRLRIDFIAHGV